MDNRALLSVAGKFALLGGPAVAGSRWIVTKLQRQQHELEVQADEIASLKEQLAEIERRRLEASGSAGD